MKWSDVPILTVIAVGVVGFCMGGQLALYAAATNPDKVSACVDYYGIHPNVHPPLENLKAPVLGIYAEHDAYVTPAVVHELEASLKQHGKSVEMHIYKDRDHGFFNDTRKEVYDEKDATDAWNRVLKFFGEHVK